MVKLITGNFTTKTTLLSGIFVLSALLQACSSVVVRDKVDRDDINGGFESVDSENSPEGWYANNLPQTKKYAELSVDNSVSHSGSKSIRISILNKEPQESTNYNWVRPIDGLKNGSIYEMDGWVKTLNVKNSPFIELEFLNNEKLIGTASTLKGNLVTGIKNWNLIKVIFKVPVTTSKVIIKAGINSSTNAGGKVWFDDIKITETR